MVELDKFSAEKNFFDEDDIMALPHLVRFYFEEKKYSLVYYLADLYQKEFASLNFYKMLALLEMEKFSAAKEIYKLYGDDWLNICKQYNIYWKDVILFALYFRQKNLTDWFQELLNSHYDSELVQIFELADEYSQEDFIQLPQFKNFCESHPALKKFYTRSEPTKTLVTFEKVQWRVWGKYNRKLRDAPLDENKMQCVYNRNGLKIFS